MNNDDKKLILKHLNALITSSDQMVLHYEILGQEEEQKHMEFESEKWQYLLGLVEADMSNA